jgi:hypothetical protein
MCLATMTSKMRLGYTSECGFGLDGTSKDNGITVEIIRVAFCLTARARSFFFHQKGDARDMTVRNHGAHLPHPRTLRVSGQ